MPEKKICSTCESSECPALNRKPEESLEEFLERQQLQGRLWRIKHKILVLSGRGGVGKSTVAVNFAVALSLGVWLAGSTPAASITVGGFVFDAGEAAFADDAVVFTDNSIVNGPRCHNYWGGVSNEVLLGFAYIASNRFDGVRDHHCIRRFGRLPGRR